MELPQWAIVAAELGFTPLNLVLIAMLYFMGANSGFFPKFWGKRKVDLPATQTQMDILSEHYNHETTAILTDIRDLLEKQTANIDEVKRKQEEWEKYGVPARCINLK
jgi:hypothetical protein